jgi:alkanesulfonate monooxygenase SsuD/methylene tetrahydromethanopterin reductase-like flavin-dependent oxidoreductase (luciferase family)
MWATSLLALTKRITIFSTINAQMFHPLIAAKQFATADQVGHGRMGMNVVCGWNQDEFSMFGIDTGGHEKRYTYGREWLEVIQRLWRETEEFDYDGELIKLKNLISDPKPYGGSRPLILNAAASPAGRDFATDLSDVLFTLLADPEQGKASVEAVRKLAKAKGRNDIQVFTAGFYVCRPTRQEAVDYYHYYTEQMADEEAYEHLRELHFQNTSLREAQSARELKMRHIGGNGSFPMVGTPDDVANALKLVHDTGYGGIAASFVNYLDEFPYFRDEVLPRLERMGLREPVTA